MPRSYIIYAIFAFALAVRSGFMFLVMSIDFAWESYQRLRRMNVDRGQVGSNCIRSGGYID
jgi:hypothetical protein